MQESPDMNPAPVLDILKFWHKVEFFVPFDLEDACSQLKNQYVLTIEQLENHGDDVLPWRSHVGLKKAGGVPENKYQYYLYLLPFNKNELTRLSEEKFLRDAVIPNDVQKVEFEEKFDDEGETCFARLVLDAQGRFDVTHFSLSTLPWALGKLIANNLAALNAAQYETDQIKLKTELRLLAGHLQNADSVLNINTLAKTSGMMNAKSLLALLHILKCWAGFSPRHPVALVIQLRQLPQEKAENALEYNKDFNAKTLSVNNETAQKNETYEDDTLDILNSFYLEDLEKICNDKKLDKNIITAYIQGNKKACRKNIYDQAHLAFIAEKLSPKYTSEGRWLHESHHLMSLMQQFAINECFHPDENQSALFSVNGPPGTGKTTLLQDIVAANIVNRATVLAEFEKTSDTFRPHKLSVTFGDNSHKEIRLLNDRLTGFEMIVVSSNNAAIENISRELPLKSKIAKTWQTTSCQYLGPVVAKVFAEHVNKRVRALSDAQKPWGLISVSLGNSANRNRFCDRVFYAPEGKEESKARIEAGEYLTLWEWKKKYHGPSFSDARKDFLKAQQALRNYQQQIMRFSDLHIKVAGKNLEAYLNQYCAGQLQEIAECERKNAVLAQQEQSLTMSLEQIVQQQKNLHQQLLTHQQFKPGILEFLLFSSNAKSYKRHKKALQAQWHQLLEEEKKLKSQLEHILQEQKKTNREYVILQDNFEKKKQAYARDILQYQALQEMLDDIILPPMDGNFDHSEVQFAAFWQNAQLNSLRSEIFIQALKLHEAWLYEAMDTEKFSGNLIAISALLKNRRPIDPAHELAIWQSFFMWVPVVSSTFASVGRQFKNIGPSAFGWLLIDEAGQAIPQAAVGALWRTQRAIVVGDPLQIEPVFTIPPRLIEGLARYFLSFPHIKWLPTQTSVQILADAANSIGTYVKTDEKMQWIGSPLRVHRRCLDPMFKIANEIAYNNKMLNARKPAEDMAGFPESAWFHVVGNATDKQYIPEQGEYLAKLFSELYAAHKMLPALYIITPFKRIKIRLQKLLREGNLWQQHLPINIYPPTTEALNKWCSTHIGTVHTFQGKEAPLVIFVLGADKNQQGAANWASSKPNLLNVALTRAKDTIYIIGDYDLWSGKKYFSALAEALSVKNYLQEKQKNPVSELI